MAAVLMVITADVLGEVAPTCDMLTNQMLNVRREGVKFEKKKKSF
jgi:hypothetical protein